MNTIKEQLVSIAIATYNGEKYLAEQLESIYNQNYKNIEVIICDDKSNDNTVNILEGFKTKFGLKYSVNEYNLGVVENFEKAISKCAGEYIFLSDQDDIWMPNKIETLVNEIGDYSLIYSNGYLMNDNPQLRKISDLKWMKPFGIDSKQDEFYKYLIFNSFILGCSLMFKRELLNIALPIYRSHRNHDWWLVLCAENQCGVKYIDDALFYYRMHETNYSIMPKLSIQSKLFDLFSVNRVESRKLLYNNDKLIFEYLAINSKK